MGSPSFLRTGRVAAQIDALGRKQLYKRVDKQLPALVHAERQQLHNEIIAVFVADKRGQIVRFRKHETVAIAPLKQLFAQARRLGNALAKELLALLFAPADKHPHQDFGKMVDVPLSDIPSVKREYLGKRSVFVLALDFCHFVGVHPAVSRQNALLFAAL